MSVALSEIAPRDLPAAIVATIMGDHEIVDAAFTAIVNLPIEDLDIGSWSRSLVECDAECAAALITATPQGKRMAINVEMVDDGLKFWYHVEILAEKDHVILESISDLLTRAGRSTHSMRCEMIARQIDYFRSEFTFRIRPIHPPSFLLDDSKQELFRGKDDVSLLAPPLPLSLYSDRAGSRALRW